jgi:hypothetical protein
VSSRDYFPRDFFAWRSDGRERYRSQETQKHMTESHDRELWLRERRIDVKTGILDIIPDFAGAGCAVSD